MRGQDLLTFIVYDITDDKIRLSLDHIQYSVFSGPLDATRRKEMFARLDDTLGGNEGKILMLPVCEKDVAARREIVRVINPQ